MLEEPQRKRKFRPGISPWRPTERDFLPDKEPRKKAPQFLRQSALRATARLQKAARSDLLCWEARTTSKHLPHCGRSEVSGGTGRLLRRSGTISIVRCPVIKAGRSARMKSTRSLHSSSRRMASFVKVTSWTPKH